MVKNRKPKPVGNSKKRPRGRLKGTRITVQPSNVISALAERFAITSPVLTYQDVADYLTVKTGLRVTRASVWRLARELKDGVIPKHSNKLRTALGLPCYAPAVVCPVHGVVHAGKCPRPKPAPKSLFDWPVKKLAESIRNRQ